MLVACAGEKMSVEHAKQVTVSMSGEAFVPPPRRIDDILSILDQPGQFDKEITEKHRIIADQQPPKSDNPNRLHPFYVERGQASMQLSRWNQALRDFRIALYYSRKAKIRDSWLLNRIGIVEIYFGNVNRGIAFLKESLRDQKRVSTYYHLVSAYTRLGDLETAENLRKEGVGYARKINSIVVRINAARMSALVLEARGKIKEAEKHRRKALDLSPSIKALHPYHMITHRVYLAKNLMQQGRFSEAEHEIRIGLKVSKAHAGQNSEGTGHIIATFGKILQKQGRLSDAEKLIRRGIQLQENSGISSDSSLIGGVKMLYGDVLVDQQKYSEAMKIYDEVKKNMINNNYFFEKNLSHNQNLMLCLIKENRVNEAIKLISSTYSFYRINLGNRHYRTVETLGLRGVAYFSQKNFKQATNDFSKSIPRLLVANAANKGSYSARQRFKLIIETYIDLLAQIHGSHLEHELKLKAPAEAFRLADAVRGHVVQRALGASGARVAARNPVLADLVRREQDSYNQINALQTILINTLSTPVDQRDPAANEKLRAKLDTLRRARQTLLEEIKRQFPKYSDFTNPQPATISMAKKHLLPNEALISIYTTDDHSYVWAIPFDGKIKFSRSNMGKKKITRIVNQLRKALAPDPKTLGDIPAFDLQQAYELYNHLFKPVEADWKEVQHLIIVAHGPLGQLPFAILPTLPAKLQEEDILFANYQTVPWLIHKVSITRQPSVSSFVTFRSLPQGNPERKAFAGFGDPFFNKDQAGAKKEIAIKKSRVASLQEPLHVRGIRITDVGNLDNEAITSSHLGMLNRLPDTSDEILSIANALNADPQKDVFLGIRASEQIIKTMDLSDRRVIAFATHALVPGDLDGLNQPALALCSPEVTGEKEDGLLTLGEILKLKLNADWVVLSACNTGAADGAGAEAVSGLGRAFFYAGSRAILVSMWPVETTSARQLTSKLFEYQKKDKTLSRAGALRQSILALKDGPGIKDPASGKIVASYAHPFFWAPFIIVGESGSNAN
jgi:CHAT domain-containing protein/Tfp pilus assembly protein PilF